MNKQQTIKYLNYNGIYQLNKGESVADAINFIQGKITRKGYRVKSDSGRGLTENEIISNENSIAFHKFTPAEFNEDFVESIEDIPNKDDIREDKSKRGIIINCFYCGTCIRVDKIWTDDKGDYQEPIETIHCESCMRDAISRLAM